jgi:hypothetical protein
MQGPRYESWRPGLHLFTSRGGGYLTKKKIKKQKKLGNSNNLENRKGNVKNVIFL